MNSEQRHSVTFLRQLAQWLEDGKELEYLSCNKWEQVPSVILDGIRDMSEKLRPKPEPLEGWLVIVQTGYLYYTTPEEAEAAAARSNYVRTVHLREVTDE